MRIIGLTGPARTGKDTAAHAIRTLYAGRGEVKIEGFAWRLKLSAYRLFKPDATREEALAWADEIKTTGRVSAFVGPSADDDIHITGRQYLQRYGTEAHRDVFSKDFWLDAVIPVQPISDVVDDLICTRDDCAALVIPDVRFTNEAERIAEVGGEVWRLSRPGTAAVDAHASEVPIPADLVNHELVNDGTIADLHDKVFALL